MHLFHRLALHWPALLSCGAALGALALLWRVRDMPLQPAAVVRIDALGAFFAFAILGGLALMSAAWPGGSSAPSWRVPVLVAVLLVGFITTLTPVIAGAFLLFAILTLPPRFQAG